MEYELDPTTANDSVLPFQDLVAPHPIQADPPPAARWLGFVAVLVGGFLGAMVGYGTADLMSGSSNGAAIGAAIGGLTGAVGVGVVVNLTLRAMNEWRSVKHPEAAESSSNRSEAADGLTAMNTFEPEDG